MKISVIIPAYNEEKHIALCISSLLNQNSAEIIIVNDGSTDKTEKTAKLFSRYVKIINLKKRSGVANARNVGVKVAKGDIVAFIDADSIAGPHWISSIKKDMKKNVALVGPLKPLFEENIRDYTLPDAASNIVRLSVKVKPFVWGSNMACKRKFFEKVGGFRKVGSLEDFDLGYRLFKLGRIGFSKKMLVYTSLRRFKKDRMAAFSLIANSLKLLAKLPTDKLKNIR
jgi:glycosyltransferase involved in cell wall biosynthesis